MHDIAIIGAGPYGLSIASHLAGDNRDFRIFGAPMQTWLTQMPAGMHLKSEGFASSLYDPEATFRLRDYCADHGLPYADIGLPVPLETFSKYGLAFQKKFVPGLECSEVKHVQGGASGFAVTLSTGETAHFRRVVVATGITHFAHVATQIASLPTALVSHSSGCADPRRFAGKNVLVVGGGSSAADCAALLSDAGACTTLITRRPKLSFHAPPQARTLRQRLRQPYSVIGPGWKYLACAEAPFAFHALPQATRLKITSRFLGPAPCWFVRDSIERSVKTHTSTHIVAAGEEHGKAAIRAVGPDGTLDLSFDHVVAATGYRVEMDRLTFLDARIRQDIRLAGNAPVLSGGFESSVPGLYFVGVTAANAFGPLLRFACGANFTSRRLLRELRAPRPLPRRPALRAAGLGGAFGELEQAVREVPHAS